MATTIEWDGWVTVAVLAALMIVLVKNWAPADFSMAFALTVLMSTQIVTVPQALQGFSSSSVLTVAVLYIVAAGMNATGALDYYFGKALGYPKSIPEAQFRLLLPVGFVSAFLNNTPVVAMLIPVIQRWARRIKIPVSQLLMPLSFAAILGGTCTLIGTSTNLVVVGKFQERYPNEPIGIFDLTAVGFPVMLSGFSYILIFATRWLPGQAEIDSRAKDESRVPGPGASSEPLVPGLSARVAREYNGHNFRVSCVVKSHSIVARKSIGDAGLRGLDGLFLTSVQRGDAFHPAVGPEFILEAGDILHFSGMVEKFDSFCLRNGFEILPIDTDDLDPISWASQEQFPTEEEKSLHENDRIFPQWERDEKNFSRDRVHSSEASQFAGRSRVFTLRDRITKAIVRDGSFLVGKTPKEADFRSIYNAAILSLSRQGFDDEVVRGNVGKIPLQIGDVLLLLEGDYFDWNKQPTARDLKPQLSHRVISAYSSEDSVPEHLVSEVANQFEREFLIPMKVSSTSQLVGARPLVGLSVEAAGLRGLPGVFLVAIQRENGSVEHVVGPEATLTPNDTLWFVGEREGLSVLRRVPGLEPIDNQANKLKVQRLQRRLVECVVSMRSDLLGKTVKEAKFRTRFEAAIIAVHRHGRRVLAKIGDIEFKPGDVLVLETGPSFLAHFKNDPNFLLVAEIADSAPAHFDKFAITAISAIGMIVVSIVASDYVDLLQSAVYASAIMIVTKCITASAARDSVSWEVIVTVATAFGLSKALENTGVAAATGEALVKLAIITNTGFFGVLIAVYLATFAISLIVANNAAALLMFPIAVLAAEQSCPAEVEEAMCIKQTIFILMLAASSSFATPYGYQTNMMVLGCGNYVFMDFFRFGFPLQLWQLVFSSVAVYYLEFWYISMIIAVLGFVIVVIVRLNVYRRIFNSVRRRKESDTTSMEMSPA